MRTCDSKVPTFIAHGVDLPRCCPVSGNPAPGSRLTVCYIPDGIVFPVEDLESFVREYIGGHDVRSVRNMEEMIQDLAVRVREEVKVRVRVIADLKIDPPYGGSQQTMRVTARA